MLPVTAQVNLSKRLQEAFPDRSFWWFSLLSPVRVIAVTLTDRGGRQGWTVACQAPLSMGFSR